MSLNSKTSSQCFNEENLLVDIPHLSKLESGLPHSPHRENPRKNSNTKYRKRFEFNDHSSPAVHQISGSYLHLSDLSPDPPSIEFHQDHFPQPVPKSGPQQLSQALRHFYDQREGSDDWQRALRDLIELKIRINNERERSEQIPGDSVLLRGHSFRACSLDHRLPWSCQVCGRLLLSLLYDCYFCADCRLACHVKCAPRLSRPCPVPELQSFKQFPLQICPDVGLHAQDYLCYECSAPISYQNTWNPPRICDFSGKYYCSLCHRNDLSINPVRLLVNWDVRRFPVSRASLQKINLLGNRPIIDPSSYPALSAVPLDEIMEYRRRIALTRGYLWRCHQSDELLAQLEESDTHHQLSHVFHGSKLFTLEDVLALRQGVLLSRLVHIFSLLSNHVKFFCRSCRAMGARCGLCGRNDLVHQFDSDGVFCGRCSAGFHRLGSAHSRDCLGESHLPCCPL